VILAEGDLRLDPATKRAWRAGTELRLTPKEFALLEVLLAHPGQVLTRSQIIEAVAYESTQSQERRELAVGGAVFVAAAGLGAYGLARAALSPVERLRRQVATPGVARIRAAARASSGWRPTASILTSSPWSPTSHGWCWRPRWQGRAPRVRCRWPARSPATWTSCAAGAGLRCAARSAPGGAGSGRAQQPLAGVPAADCGTSRFQRGQRRPEQPHQRADEHDGPAMPNPTPTAKNVEPKKRART